MIKYIIDGNNLMGKIPEIKKIMSSQKDESREKLVFMLDRFFAKKKTKVSLHLDGFPATPVKSSKCKITYSYEKPADDFIRIEISNSKNPKNISLVTSDFALGQFAKKCSCKWIKSEDFVKELNKVDDQLEEDIIKSISNDEIFKLFNN